MATEAAARTFFSSPQFAVVGASSDPNKFGHKIFTWYTHHHLPVTPINPSSPSITALPPPSSSTSSSTSSSPTLATYPAIASLSALPSPTSTSVSIITPPKVTLKVLQEAQKLGIPAVWLQPGTFDAEVWEFANSAFGEGTGRALVGGEGGRGGEGWCVLVDGERALKGAEKEKEKEKGLEGKKDEGKL